ncbi:(d)CMP kinase [Carnobacteriaceae bacterium zg-84]|uniref:(d)CMP kinase n=1 Tax=Granulicatella sp. zg-84 TaxID=2678503 RepID=UPI0013C159D6|nr:(d)CMP kinase [Granulicatella sp. zg-84]NEW66449.1 (d)CMP kinase [Granulicatella sp. zg-84]QMI86347.1 (d)CMP kinase [Carnobacteriaceae bacterium zg-84]
MSKKICVAIDGPASSGKSTVAKRIAEKFNYIYLDTGAMYRCITLSVLSNDIDMQDEQAVSAHCQQQDIRFSKNIDNQQIVLLNGKDVTSAIRQPNVAENVSLVASYEGVRTDLVARQKSYIAQGGIVMDGRDVGTVVMPEAELKIFMVASVEERARRRHEENKQRGIHSSLGELCQQIEKRDKLDESRVIGPLKKAEDAIEIDTTSLTIDEVIQQISEYIEMILN